MERVTGIGGLFFRSQDPDRLTRWYAEHLGVTPPPPSYDDMPWWQESGPTVLGAFPQEASLFGREEQTWMINFRVRDLEAIVSQLRTAGIEVEIDPEEYPNGRFARLQDPESNPIQLWEPRGKEASRPIEPETRMNMLEKLMSYAGSWRGNNRLQDPITNTPQDSPSTATISPMLDGRFIRMDYTWEYQGQPQTGSLLIGYEAEAGVVTAHWIDTWHMGDKVMACRGAVNSSGDISVLGSYAAPPGPDWGWRIIVTPDEGHRLRMVMFNILPDGQEVLAVETDYTRV